MEFKEKGEGKETVIRRKLVKEKKIDDNGDELEEEKEMNDFSLEEGKEEEGRATRR